MNKLSTTLIFLLVAGVSCVSYAAPSAPKSEQLSLSTSDNSSVTTDILLNSAFNSLPMSRANWLLDKDKILSLVQNNHLGQSSQANSASLGKMTGLLAINNAPQLVGGESKALGAITREIEALANSAKIVESQNLSSDTLANKTSEVIEPADKSANASSAFSLVQKYSSAAQDVILKGLELIGTAYRYGGNTAATGLDCSGFVKLVFDNALGLALPRTAVAMSNEGKVVERQELRAGDLVFFNTMRRTFSHVGIYLGDNTFLHAPRTGAKIRIESMDSQYWMTRYNGARRVINIIKGK